MHVSAAALCNTFDWTDAKKETLAIANRSSVNGSVQLLHAEGYEKLKLL